MIRFHGYFRSSSAYRCRIAFNLKGIEPAFSPVHLRRGGGEQKQAAYKALNPQSLVPTMEDGDFVLTQSLAIIEWLDESFPEPALLPSDKNERAFVRSFAQAVACDIHPLQNLRVLDYLKAELNQQQAGLDAWCQRWIGDGLAACEALLERHRTNGPFIGGSSPGLADICLVPQMFSADRFGIDTGKFTQLQRIREACEQLDAFTRAHPARQPDSEG
jgi:maleylacetoacetate isomerase